MKIGEIFSGTPQEQAAARTVRRLNTGRRLGTRETNELKNAQIISRRLLLRKLGVAALGTAAGIGGLGYLLREISIDDDKEHAYQQYVASFENLAHGDPEAEEILSFVKEKRKRGIFKNGQVRALEPGDQTNFYTAIVDSHNTQISHGQLSGFASFDQTATPTHMLLKDIPIDPIWQGAIFGHEVKHAYQWLNGIEPGRPDGFIWGEVEAFDFEFKLLDKATQGRFKQVLRQQEKTISDTKYRGLLSTEDMMRLYSLFPRPRSDEEQSARIPALVIALNFTHFEERSSKPEIAREQQFRYIQGIFTGETKIIGVNS